MPLMHGATIDISSPDKVSPQGVLALFKALIDQKWTDIIKKNYSAVKKQLAAPKGTNRGKQNKGQSSKKTASLICGGELAKKKETAHQHRRRDRNLRAQQNVCRSGFQPDMSDWKSDLRFCEAL